MEKDYSAIITRIVDLHQSELNDWELEFISSVYDWHILRSGELSQKQKDCISKINKKVIK